MSRAPPPTGVGSFLMTGFFSSFLSSFLSADLSFFSWAWVKAAPRRRVTTRIEAVRIESSTLFSAVAARVAELGHRAQRQGRQPVQRISLQYLGNLLERYGFETLQLLVDRAIFAEVGPRHADGLHAPHRTLAGAEHARPDLVLDLYQV